MAPVLTVHLVGHGGSILTLGEGAAASDPLQLSESHLLCILKSSCLARKAASLLGDVILGD